MNKSIKFHAKNCGAVFNFPGLGKADNVVMSEEQLERFAKSIVNDCLDILSHQILMNEGGVENPIDFGMSIVRHEYAIED